MATNFVKAKFQEIYDMGTVSGKTTILGIHTPQGDRVQNLLGGFFRQFRKFRYSGCSVTMVPAAQLPADPLQVSFEAGELTCDPRDLLNPILFHGCHGESMNEILNTYLSMQDVNENDSVGEVRPSLAEAESGYYSALSDPSFRKFGIQSGAKVSLRPMVHPLVMTNPIVPTDADTISKYKVTVSGTQVEKAVASNGEPVGMSYNFDDDSVANNGTTVGFRNLIGMAPYVDTNGNDTYVSVHPVMFSNGLKALGWLPTTASSPAPNGNGSWTVGGAITTTPTVQSVDIGPTILPKLFMGMFILPPSYTQEMYFRLILTHYFEFKDFTTCLALNPNGPQSAYKETIPEPTTTSLEVVNGNVALTTDGVY